MRNISMLYYCSEHAIYISACACWIQREMYAHYLQKQSCYALFCTMLAMIPTSKCMVWLKNSNLFNECVPEVVKEIIANVDPLLVMVNSEFGITLLFVMPILFRVMDQVDTTPKKKVFLICFICSAEVAVSSGYTSHSQNPQTQWQGQWCLFISTGSSKQRLSTTDFYNWFRRNCILCVLTRGGVHRNR